MEGIKTLERKDEQRASKTALLLSLRGDVTALAGRLAAEEEASAKAAAWIRDSLRPALAQLRGETLAESERCKSCFETGRRETLEREAALERRVAESEARAQQFCQSLAESVRAEVAAVKEASARQAAAAREEAIAASKKMVEDAANHLRKELVADLQRAKEEAAAAQAVFANDLRKWSEEKVREWSARQQEAASNWSRAAEERWEAAMKNTQQKLQTFCGKEAEHSARLRSEWEAKKEVWFASFAKEAEQLRQSFAEKTAQLLENASAASSARFAELERSIEARGKAEHDAANRWRNEVWGNVLSWQERYGPFIATLIQAEKTRLATASLSNPGNLGGSSGSSGTRPVPAWLTEQLTACGLEQYGPLLAEKGFDLPQTFGAIEANDLAFFPEMSAGHRKLLLLHVEDMRKRQVVLAQDQEYENRKRLAENELRELVAAKTRQLDELAQLNFAEIERLQALRRQLAPEASAMPQLPPPEVPAAAPLVLELENKGTEKKEAKPEAKPEAVAVATVAAVVEQPPKAAAAPEEGKKPAVAASPPRAVTKAKGAEKAGKKPPGPKRKEGGRLVPPPPDTAASAAVTSSPKTVQKTEVTKAEHVKVEEPKAVESKAVEPKAPAASAKKTDSDRELFAGVLFIEDVVSLIREYGEKEPNGRRYRILLRTLRQRCDKKVGAGELEKLLLAMAASGLVTLKQGEQLHDGSIITFVPQTK